MLEHGWRFYYATMQCVFYYTLDSEVYAYDCVKLLIFKITVDISEKIGSHYNIMNMVDK